MFSLETHLNTISEHKTHSMIYKCKKCPYITKSLFFIENHIKIHQGAACPVFNCSDNLECFVCTRCNFITYHVAKFKNHIESHSVTTEDIETRSLTLNGLDPLNVTFISEHQQFIKKELGKSQYVQTLEPSSEYYESKKFIPDDLRKSILKDIIPSSGVFSRDASALQHSQNKEEGITDIRAASAFIEMNILQRLSKLSHENKIKIKQEGRPTPDLKIEENATSRGKPFIRRFNKDVYNKNNWICGCNKLNAFFCFPCLLFGGEAAWTLKGISSLNHLTEKIKKHATSKGHLFNETELALLGQVNVRAQLDSSYYINNRRHNEEVSRNRYILSKIINCIKFCGLFELALRGLDESADSENPGIFRGLINFTAELDKTFNEHLKNATAFKGTSRDIQNDLLDCILVVCQKQIIKEVQEAEFLAVMSDETSDVLNKFQMVNILRYVKHGNPTERFWNFMFPESHNAETLAGHLLTVIDKLLNGQIRKEKKLIAQCFDGALGGVQAKIKEKHPFAHFIHCYSHQLSLIMAQAASQNTEARSFFSNLHMIPDFFSNSPQRTAVLEKVVNKKIPAVSTCWNFKSRTVNLVYELRNSLIECMENIEGDVSCSNATLNQCTAIKRMLRDKVFVFWLTFFTHVMPYVDVLYSQLQKRTLDATYTETSVDNFVRSIENVRSSIVSIMLEAEAASDLESLSKKRRIDNPENRKVAALEICDVIINQARDRFSFKGHLSTSLLFINDHFEEYSSNFPEDLLNLTSEAYPMLDKARLATELSVIYMRTDFREARGATALLNFLIRNNLEETFKETKRCLEIIITTPMTTSEGERCFSTLKRIKTFLKNPMSENRLNVLAPLAMISVQHDLLEEIHDFNEQVIEEFANRKERRISLTFKK